MTEKQNSSQIIELVDRRRLSIGCVEDVLSFDDKNIILTSSLGSIAVDGQNLSITKLSLDGGELLIEGEVGGVLFFEPDAPKKRSFFRKRSGT